MESIMSLKMHLGENGVCLKYKCKSEHAFTHTQIDHTQIRAVGARNTRTNRKGSKNRNSKKKQSVKKEQKTVNTKGILKLKQ
jgi:hypothetical protein